MTHEQAVALRVHHLQGLYVDPEALAQAIAVIQSTRTPTARLRNGEKNPRQPNKRPKPKTPRTPKEHGITPQQPPGVDIDAVHSREPWTLYQTGQELPPPAAWPYPEKP